jgi:hypothetical protein
MRFVRVRRGRIHPPESVADAVEVCREEGADYLLYGYVVERAYNYQAEVRLFDYGSRRVRQVFYGMDDGGHYERLVKELAGKILGYMAETFHLSVAGEEAGFTRIFIPVAAGYWTPASSGWARRMVGTFNIVSGVAVIPSDRVWVAHGYTFYLSAGLEAGYRLGVGHPERYEAYDHSLYVNLPVVLHMALKDRHHVYGGLGFVYFVDFLNMTQKYAGSETFVYNNTGVSISFGYRFFLKRELVLCIRSEFALQFSGKVLFSYAPFMGLEFQVYEKEIWEKW